MPIYNASYVTDAVALITTIEAEDESEAHDLGFERIADELGLNLITNKIRYQIEIEELENKENTE